MKIDGFSEGRIRTRIFLPLMIFFSIMTAAWLLFFYPEIKSAASEPLGMIEPIFYGVMGLSILIVWSCMVPAVSFGKGGIRVSDGETDIYLKDDLLRISYSKQTGFSLIAQDGREYHDRRAVFDDSIHHKLAQLYPGIMISEDEKWKGESSAEPN